MTEMNLTVVCAISLNGCIADGSPGFTSLLHNTADKAPDLQHLQTIRSQGMVGSIVGNKTYQAYPQVRAVDHDQPLIHVIMSRSGQVNRHTPLFAQTKHPVVVAQPADTATPQPGNLLYKDIPDLIQQLHLRFNLPPNAPWIVEGGGHVVQTFSAWVKHYWLTVCPVWLDGGIPLFHQGWLHAGGWQLVQVRPLAHAVILQYDRAVNGPA
jgi:dihydrofolate reductase